MTALLGAGLELTLLEEHTTVPWTALPGMVDTGGGEMRARGAARAAAVLLHATGAQAHLTAPESDARAADRRGHVPG